MALPNRGPRFNPRFQRQQEPEHRINDRIRVPQIRLVGDNITVGVYNTQDALKIAADQGLDLVEISPSADPPVCKVIDYKKFLYEKKLKEKEMKANSKQSEIKEIRFTPGTDDHDFDFKAKHAEKFLQEYPVSFTVLRDAKGEWADQFVVESMTTPVSAATPARAIKPTPTATLTL